MSNNQSSDSRVEILFFVLGVAILTYVGGAYTATFRTFPYSQLLEAPFEAMKAREEKQKVIAAGAEKTNAWNKPKEGGPGLLERKDGAFEGYTAYTSGHATSAFLLGMDGEVVHKWHKPFREVWPEAPQVADPVPESHIYWRRAHVYPNGDILAMYVGLGDTPYGYGTAKFDADSNLIWKYSGNTHHDFDVVEDSGEVYVLTHGMRDTDENPVEGVPQLPNPTMDDHVVHLSPEGEQLQTISVLDAFANSEFRAALQMFPMIIDRPREQKWEPLHTNTVERVGREFAAHHDFAEPGHLLISMRGLDIIALLDPETEKIVWATRGFWWQQHDPDALANGNILVFDNNSYGGPGGPSRILEFDPHTNAVVWSYVGPWEEDGEGAEPFFSISHGAQQPLPNGNVLISSSNQGWLFEVNRAGEIVWSFRNPMQRVIEGRTYVPRLCGGHRYAPEELPFLSERESR